jgi:hypothetical protein
MCSTCRVLIRSQLTYKGSFDLGIVCHLLKHHLSSLPKPKQISVITATSNLFCVPPGPCRTIIMKFPAIFLALLTLTTAAATAQRRQKSDFGAVARREGPTQYFCCPLDYLTGIRDITNPIFDGCTKHGKPSSIPYCFFMLFP